jgi:hypothetical protein
MNRTALPALLPGACGGLRLAILGGLALAGALLEADPLTGGSYVLVGAPATGGTSQGGGFAVTGYVAAAGAGTSSGGQFDLTCGLIGVYALPDGDVALQAELTIQGNVRLWWPADAAGYQLEFTTALGPGAIWQAVQPAPVGNEYVTGPSQPARFFRLRRP